MTPSTALDFDGLRPPAAGLTAEHDEWRLRVRQFVEIEIAPHLDQWNRAGTFPDAVYQRAAAAGLLGMGFPESFGGCRPEAGLYHRIIMAEEMHRLGSGVVFADLATHWIGLPPVVGQGNSRLDDEVVRPVLAGEKKISFAVTEPGGGSDVGCMTTRAQRSGDNWLVTGEKTLISGVMRAVYAYLDQCVERFEQGDESVADLGLLKIQASTTLERCAREALHVLGGTAYQGVARLERIYRESRIFAVAGGTEEVLRDLVARQLKF